MFPQIHITDNQIVKYWNDQSEMRNSFEIGNQKIEFHIVKNKKIITIHSKYLLKDLAFMFLQGQIVNEKNQVIIEAKPMLKKIILWNFILILIISIIQLKHSIVLPIGFLLVFLTIILYQRNQMKNASYKMEKILKSMGGNFVN